MKKSANISITPELLAHAEAMVASGEFQNVSEYMRALVREDKHQRDYNAKLLELIQEGMDSGEPISLTPEQAGEYIQRGIERARQESDRKAG